MPGAEARKIRRKYEEKASLLRPELISGAPPDVVTAVRRAQELLDTAWEVLGGSGEPQPLRRGSRPPAFRRRPRSAGDWHGPAGLTPAGLGITSGLTGWPGPRRQRNRSDAVPDVRGLFYQVSLEVATRRGFHLRTIRLTERPMAVDGLVVDQDPRPPTKAHRDGTFTVQVWHPPARPVTRTGSAWSSPQAASPSAGSGPKS